MKEIVEERAARLGEYIVEQNTTVRKAAGKFGISKSTVHTEVTITNGLFGWWHNPPQTRINKGFSARHTAVLLFFIIRNTYNRNIKSRQKYEDITF